MNNTYIRIMCPKKKRSGLTLHLYGSYPGMRRAFTAEEMVEYFNEGFFEFKEELVVLKQLIMYCISRFSKVEIQKHVTTEAGGIRTTYLINLGEL